MPREIPQYQRQGYNNQNNYAGHIGQTVNSGSIGSGISSFGAGIAQVGSQLQGAALQKAREDKAKAEQHQAKLDDQQALRVFSEIQITDMQREQEYRGQYSDDINKFANNDLGAFDQFYKDFATEPLTPGAQEKLDTLIGRYRLGKAESAITHQGKLIGAQAKANIEQGTDNIINSTRLDPFNLFSENEKKLDLIVDAAKGMLPETALSEYKSQIHAEHALRALRGIGDQDPSVALAILEGKMEGDEYKAISEAVKNLPSATFDSVLSGFKRQLEAEKTQMDNHYVSEISAKLDDHFASIKDTGKPVVTQAEINAISDPNKRAIVQEKYDFMNKVGKAWNDIVRGSENLPIQEQLKLAEKLKPKGGEENYVERDNIYRAVVSEIAQSYKAWDEDPFKAATNNSQVAQAMNRSEIEGRRANVLHQINKGIPFNKLKVAANEEVEEDSRQLSELLKGQQFDQIKSYIDAAKEKYNAMALPDGRTGWDVYLNQLNNVKGFKLPDELVMALQFEDIPEGSAIYQAIQTSDKDWKTLVDKDTIEAVDDKIKSLASSYNKVWQTLPGFGGRDKLASKMTLASKYAYSLISSGLSGDQAAQKAYGVIYNYDVVDNNKMKLIIPKEINGTKIDSQSVQTSLNELSNSDLIYSRLTDSIPEGKPPARTLQRLSVKDYKGREAFLRSDAADAFEAANTAMKNAGLGGIQVNSANRTRAEQQALYNKLNGVSAVAKPGKSWHEFGKALDVQNHEEAKPYLEKHGFRWKNYNKDPYHFDFVGDDTYTRIGSLPERLSSKERRNQYARELSRNGVWRISGDSMYAVLYSKNTDGSETVVFDGNHIPYKYPLINLSKGDYSTKVHNIAPVGLRIGYNEKGRAKAVVKKVQRQSQYIDAASGLKGQRVYSHDEADFVLDRGF